MLVEEMVDQLSFIVESVAAVVTEEAALDPGKARSIGHASLALLHVLRGISTWLHELFTVRALFTASQDCILELLCRGLWVEVSIFDQSLYLVGKLIVSQELVRQSDFEPSIYGLDHRLIANN